MSMSSRAHHRVVLITKFGLAKAHAIGMALIRTSEFKIDGQKHKLAARTLLPCHAGGLKVLAWFFTMSDIR
jgi:hypothetical protein